MTFMSFLLAVIPPEIAEILWLYNGRFLSPKMEQCKWFCFDLALKLVLYT